MCVFWGTVSGQRLLDNISKASAPGWASLVDDFVCAPWRRLKATGGAGHEEISQTAWAAMRQSFLECGYGRLDHDRLKAQKDASEFALWLLRALENPQIMQRLTWMHEEEQSTDQRPFVEEQSWACSFDPDGYPEDEVTLESLMQAVLCGPSPDTFCLPSGAQATVLMCRETIFAPDVLPVTLARSGRSVGSSAETKFRTRVLVPEHITVRFNSSGAGGDECSSVYALCGLVCHSGDSVDNGHYTAFLHLTSDTLNGWFEFDDQRLNALEPVHACWLLQSDAVQRDSCVFFYERQGPAADVEVSFRVSSFAYDAGARLIIKAL